MTCPWENHRDEAIQLDGSPRRLSPACDDSKGVKLAQAKPRQEPKVAPASGTQPADAWRVLLLNDPVNRMSYVVMVLRRVFGFDEDEARRHMLEVHESGRSVVWAGTREQAEAHMFALQQWHLTAIIQADEAT
ncbi:MAG: ATP-dependent Clp protease adaptor ClpS [Lacunisphaera sp.]